MTKKRKNEDDFSLKGDFSSAASADAYKAVLKFAQELQRGLNRARGNFPIDPDKQLQLAQKVAEAQAVGISITIDDAEALLVQADEGPIWVTDDKRVLFFYDTPVVVSVKEPHSLSVSKGIVETLKFLEKKGTIIEVMQSGAHSQDTKGDSLKERLHNAAKNAGLTQKEIANRMHVTPAVVNRVFKCPEKSSVHTIRRHADAIGVDIKDLFP